MLLGCKLRCSVVRVLLASGFGVCEALSYKRLFEFLCQVDLWIMFPDCALSALSKCFKSWDEHTSVTPDINHLSLFTVYYLYILYSICIICYIFKMYSYNTTTHLWSVVDQNF